MPRVDCVSEIAIEETARVQQVRGMFDLSVDKTSRFELSFDAPLDDHDWQIGLIVGPSGSGKSTLARELFGPVIHKPHRWPKDRSVIDGFRKSLGIKQITGMLSSVGFSSPPAWLRPFRCLSNGEQFRVSLARTLIESKEIAVVDEFTSVVDRRVAKIGSTAVAKAVRRTDKRFVAVSCHDDIIDWLAPDWVIDLSTGSFQWRCERQPRPPIRIVVRRANRSAWHLFRRHHYLNTSLNNSATCFVGTVENLPAVFCSTLYFPHLQRPSWREHRTVCLPDYQGVGIGNATSELIAAAWSGAGAEFTSVTSHPAMIHHRNRSPHWKLTRPPALSHPSGKRSMKPWKATRRLTAGFRYIGPPDPDAAKKLGLI